MAQPIGELQSKVLLYLAMNPKTHIQAIQYGLHSRNYGAIYNATLSLEKKEYVSSIKDLSKKNIEIKYYSCTEKGVYYSLLYANDSQKLKILSTNKEKFTSVSYFVSEYERMGKDDFLHWLKEFLTFIPMLDKTIAKKANIGELVGNMLLYYIEKYKGANMGERIKIVENASKSFPNVRKALDDLHVLLDHLAKEEKAK